MSNSDSDEPSVPGLSDEREDGHTQDALTDGRSPYEWWTKWPRRAQWQIGVEILLLLLLASALPFALLYAWDGRLAEWLDVPASRASTFKVYSVAWIGGLLGGTTFALKWLYHSVAKGSWHRDRALWRASTPLISGALALAMTALVRSELIGLLNGRTLDRLAGVLSFAFVVGYFSDHTIAAMARVAHKFLGETTSRGRGDASDSSTRGG